MDDSLPFEDYLASLKTTSENHSSSDSHQKKEQGKLKTLVSSVTTFFSDKAKSIITVAQESAYPLTEPKLEEEAPHKIVELDEDEDARRQMKEILDKIK